MLLELVAMAAMGSRGSAPFVLPSDDGESDWDIPDDASTVSLQPEEAQRMADDLGVDASDFLGASTSHIDPSPPMPKLMNRRLSFLTLGTHEAKQAVQDCILEYLQSPGYKPSDGSEKSLKREKDFITLAMRRRGWKLWTCNKAKHFTPQWAPAAGWRKLQRSVRDW